MAVAELVAHTRPLPTLLCAAQAQVASENGHLPQLQTAQETSRAVLAFWRKVKSSRGQRRAQPVPPQLCPCQQVSPAVQKRSRQQGAQESTLPNALAGCGPQSTPAWHVAMSLPTRGSEPTSACRVCTSSPPTGPAERAAAPVPWGRSCWGALGRAGYSQPGLAAPCGHQMCLESWSEKQMASWAHGQSGLAGGQGGDSKIPSVVQANPPT